MPRNDLGRFRIRIALGIVCVIMGMFTASLTDYCPVVGFNMRGLVSAIIPVPAIRVLTTS